MSWSFFLLFGENIIYLFMFSKPWKIKDGILVGVGLIVLGLLLQLVTGRVEWEFFAWPVNLFAVIFLLLIALTLHLLRKRFAFCGWISSLASAVPAIGFSLGLTVVMGLTRQVPSEMPKAADPIGISQMVRFWPFVLCYAWMALTILTTVMRRLTTFRWKKDIPFMLCHVGLLLIIVCGTLGNPDLRQLEMTVTEGKSESRAVSEYDGSLQSPGFSVKLNDFSIDEYPPKVYVVDRASGRPVDRTEFIDTEVVPFTMTLSGWEVTIEEMLPYAALVMVPDSTRARPDSLHFEPWQGEGAVQALLVRARKDGVSKEEWITCGNHMFPTKALELDENLALKMPEPSPKRYSADVIVTSSDGKALESTIAVNKPLKIDGWKVYLVDYDQERGRWSKIAVFELVRDPWLPFVYVGIFMLLAGAVCMFVLAGSRKSDREL